MEKQRWLNFLMLSDDRLDKQHLRRVLVDLSAELGAAQARAIFGRLCSELAIALTNCNYGAARAPICSNGHRRCDATLDSLGAPAAGERQSDMEGYDCTVRVLVNRWIANTYPEESKQHRRVHDFLHRLVLPHIGDITLAEFRASDMRSVLDYIAVTQGKRATSRLCRMWMRAALRYARTQRFISTEELWEFMDIEPVRHTTRHKVPLTTAQLRQLWADLGNLGSQKITIGIRLLLLTFVRPVELMCAPWTEFDLDGRQNEYGPTWIIPPQRVKMRTPHIVPLSRQSVALLHDLKAITGQHSLLFPGPVDNKPMTRQSWRDALCTIGWDKSFSLHACRATASTLIRELEIGMNDHIEAQLGHVMRSQTRASYDFACYVRQRHAMMKRWSDYIYKVVADAKRVAGKI